MLPIAAPSPALQLSDDRGNNNSLQHKQIIQTLDLDQTSWQAHTQRLKVASKFLDNFHTIILSQGGIMFKCPFILQGVPRNSVDLLTPIT